jgi:hypothetical protein
MNAPSTVITEEIAPQLEALCRQYAVKRLDIFGSATTGEFDAERSDIDFIVELQPCTPGERADRYFGLLFALEDLFARKVDLIEESAIKNPYFRRAVDESRQLVYAA